MQPSLSGIGPEAAFATKGIIIVHINPASTTMMHHKVTPLKMAPPFLLRLRHNGGNIIAASVIQSMTD